MTRADKAAINTKAALAKFDSVGLTVTKILIGYLDMQAIRNNTNPCSEPDFTGKDNDKRFCGIPCLECPTLAEGVAYKFL